MECIDSSMAVWQRRAKCYTVGKVWSARFLYMYTTYLEKQRQSYTKGEANRFGTYIGVIHELGNKNEASEGVYNGVRSQVCGGFGMLDPALKIGGGSKTLLTTR